jgi:hypothetical protein
MIRSQGFGMNAALHTVIRAFQADVQRALALFREHRGLDEALGQK